MWRNRSQCDTEGYVVNRNHVDGVVDVGDESELDATLH